MSLAKCLRSRFVIFMFFVTLICVLYFYVIKEPTNGEVGHGRGLMVEKREKNVLDIAVLYECLCPDSRSFFVKELLPVVERIPNQLKIEFVPYGKAETTVVGPSNYQFKCQHGPPECLGNKIHSCALTRLSDDLTRTQILTCMISGKVNPEESGKACAKEFNLDWNAIWECAQGSEGAELLKRSGDKTNALVSKVSFIPTVLLNYELGNQAAILKDLWKEVCLKFEEMGHQPKECRS